MFDNSLNNFGCFIYLFIFGENLDYMNMYFVTLRTSETGKKFQEIADKKSKIWEQCKKLADEFGFKAWYGNSFKLAGPPTALVFENDPDKSIYKKVKNGYYPKTIPGNKDFIQRLKQIDSIYRSDLNLCVNYQEDFMEYIGYASNNSDYFGFIVGHTWQFTAPSDCEEVTFSRYKELFGEIKNL